MHTSLCKSICHVCGGGGGNCGGQKRMLKLLELELQVAEDYWMQVQGPEPGSSASTANVLNH